jgi:hypothetical protein
MPHITDGLQQHTLPTGTYGFSATGLNALGASEYTLVSVVVDVSPSVGPFIGELNRTVKAIIQACKYSPRADNLLVRVTKFSGQMDEVHGFKLLEYCNADDYDKRLTTGSATALYDAAENGISATGVYAGDLTRQNFGVNGIVFVLTDGEDNSSTLPMSAVKAAIARIQKEESLESLTTVLVGVNVKDPAMANYLRTFYQQAGFTQYVEIEEADAFTLARLADFVSRSISAQSQALGTGGVAPSLSF